MKNEEPRTHLFPGRQFLPPSYLRNFRPKIQAQSAAKKPLPVST
jgi:hypothetical protein